MTEIGFIKGQGIWYSGTINVIKKKEDAPLPKVELLRDITKGVCEGKIREYGEMN